MPARQGGALERVTVHLSPARRHLTASIDIAVGGLATKRVEETVWSRAEAIGVAYRYARQHGIAEIVVEDYTTLPKASATFRLE